ncbi:hypothetical protein PC121_g24910, partial [Phytophthora cactorum]
DDEPKQWELTNSKCRLCRVEKHIYTKHSFFMKQFKLLREGEFKDSIVEKIMEKTCNEEMDLYAMVIENYSNGRLVEPTDGGPRPKRPRRDPQAPATTSFVAGSVFGVMAKGVDRAIAKAYVKSKFYLNCFPACVSPDTFTGSRVVYGLAASPPATLSPAQTLLIEEFVETMYAKHSIEFTAPKWHACVVSGPCSWEEQSYGDADL